MTPPAHSGPAETIEALLQRIAEKDREIERLTELVSRFVRAAQYVGAHRYGPRTPVGTRQIAVNDLLAVATEALNTKPTEKPKA